MLDTSFSLATLKALTDVVTGGAGNSNVPPIGIYRTAGQIEQLMMECNLDFRVGGMGSRVTRLLDFLRGLRDEDPHASTKITRAIERVAEPDDYINDPEKQQAVIDHLNRFLVQDGFEVTLLGGKPKLMTLGRSGAVVSAVSAKAVLIDFDTVQRDIERAMKSADDDPEDAVTAACSIVESVCRSILAELKLPLPAKKDIEGVLKSVQDPLGLSPARSDLPAEIAADIRQVLGGLTSVAKGVGSLRTHAGDAHGRERGFKRVDGRIARLAIHSASTITLFLIETWQMRQKRPLPRVVESEAV